MKDKRRSKRIGVDARFYGPVGKGLGRYTKEALDRILISDPENEYVVFLSPENFDGFRTENPRVKKILVRARWYGFNEQLLMPFLIWKEKIDLVHFPHFNVAVFSPAPFIVTIHDLILFNFPTIRASALSPFLYRIKNAAYKLVIKTAVKRAKKIIAVSEFTKRDILNNFRIGPDKIEVTYEGATELVSRSDRNYRLPFELPEKFILYVGNVYPHKNLEGLLAAFKIAGQEEKDLKLILVGRDDYFYSRLKQEARSLGLWREEDVNSPVIFTGFVPDAGLDILYRGALAYVFPSFYEGFGLPPLEAMTRGCPVASSDRTCLPEILGPAAFYFNPADREDMKDKILRLCRDEDLRRELSEKGKYQAVKYDWRLCAEATLKIYRDVLRNQ